MGFLKKIFLKPVAVCTVAIVLFAAGIFAAFNMPMNLLPDISYPAMAVTIAYPGASAETCENDVRPLLEEQVRALSGVRQINSYCVENAAVVAVVFEYGADTDKKAAALKDKLALVQFPEECYDPVFMQIDFNGMAVATVGVVTPTNPALAEEEAEIIGKRLLSVENVASVSTVGSAQERIVITPHSGLEMTTLLIVQALAEGARLDIPLGTIVEDGKSVAFRNDSAAASIEEIAEVPISFPIKRDMATFLRAAQVAGELFKNVDSATLERSRDNLQSAVDAINAADPPSGEEIREFLYQTVPYDDLVSLFDQLGLTDLSASAERVKTLIDENTGYLDIPSEIVGALQTFTSEYLGDEFFDTYRKVIDFRKEREFVNPITGDVTVDELTPADYAELLKVLDVPLPFEITPTVADLIGSADFSTLEYDADGNAILLLHIGEVADISLKTEYSSSSYLNGSPSVTLQVYGVSGANATEISAAVKAIVESAETVSTVVLLDDQSQFINDSITNVLSSMLIGGALAIVVIYLFLRKIRTSLIIAVTMPLSVLATIAVLYLLGVTLNMVSLGGLAVGIGMLVDNSIVIIESISFERDKGKTALEAAVDGTKLVAGSLLASTLTSICVFFPILFTVGLPKEIFSDLSYSVMISLAFSLVTALTVIPTLYCLVYSDKVMLAGKALASRIKGNKSPKSQKNAQSEDAKESKKPFVLTRLYDKILRLSLRRRWLVILLAAAIFASSALLVFLPGTEFMPSVDQRTIEVRMSFDASASLETCKTQAKEVYDDLLQNLPDVKYISASVGSTNLLETEITGVIKIVLSDKGKETKKVLEDARAIAEKHPYNVKVTELDGVLASLMSSLGELSDISATVVGEDPDTLKKITEEVRTRTLAADSRIKQVTDTFSDDAPEYRIKIDREACISRGIDYMATVTTLRAGIAGYTACKVYADGKTTDVIVRFDDGAIEEFYGGIENFVVGFDGNDAVLLGDVATVSVTLSPAMIRKLDGKWMVMISAEVADMDMGTASKILSDNISDVLSEYSGYTFAESGVNLYMNEVLGGLIITLIVSFVLLFAVMACQFESLAKPFIVIFAVPFSFTGGFLALVLTGISLNIVSMVGLIMLMGVVVNDAIVMIDRIGQLEKEYASRYEALVAGSNSRLRAIWMTTLTTVLALVPMALGIGKGAELMQPLGVVVLGGLLLATFVTLVLIPVMYSLIRGVKIPKKGDDDDSPSGEEIPTAEASDEEITATVEVTATEE